MVLIAEVKTIQASRHGHKLLLKHMPDAPVFLDEDLHHRMTRRFAGELDLWTADEHGHLIAIATFAVGRGGCATAQQIALMPTTQQWLPCSDPYTKVLLDSLVEQRRRFRVALRFSLPAADPLPAVVLTDTDRPAPLHLCTDEPAAPASGSLDACGEWVWNVADALPALPTRASAAAESTAQHTAGPWSPAPAGQVAPCRSGPFPPREREQATVRLDPHGGHP